MSKNISINADTIKRHAKRLHRVLKDEQIIPENFKLTAVQEIFSKALGCQNWFELNEILNQEKKLLEIEKKSRAATELPITTPELKAHTEFMISGDFTHLNQYLSHTVIEKPHILARNTLIDINQLPPGITVVDVSLNHDDILLWNIDWQRKIGWLISTPRGNHSEDINKFLRIVEKMGYLIVKHCLMDPEQFKKIK